jgi:hypothetical protein
VEARHIIGICMFGYGMWLLYMATFRTEEYRKLQQDNWNRAGKIFGVGCKVGGILARTYGRRLWK